MLVYGVSKKNKPVTLIMMISLHSYAVYGVSKKNKPVTLAMMVSLHSYAGVLAYTRSNSVGLLTRCSKL